MHKKEYLKCTGYLKYLERYLENYEQIGRFGEEEIQRTFFHTSHSGPRTLYVWFPEAE